PLTSADPSFDLEIARRRKAHGLCGSVVQVFAKAERQITAGGDDLACGAVVSSGGELQIRREGWIDSDAIGRDIERGLPLADSSLEVAREDAQVIRAEGEVTDIEDVPALPIGVVERCAAVVKNLDANLDGLWWANDANAVRGFASERTGSG